MAVREDRLGHLLQAAPGVQQVAGLRICECGSFNLKKPVIPVHQLQLAEAWNSLHQHQRRCEDWPHDWNGLKASETNADMT